MTLQEGQTSTMNLPDDDPAILARALTFMYIGTYSTDLCPTIAGVKLDCFSGIQDTFTCRSKEEDEYQEDASLLHTHMFAFAEMYDILSLREYAKLAFLRTWYGEPEEEAGPFADWFDDKTRTIVRAIYTTTPASVMDLRSLVISTFLLYQHDDDIKQFPDYRKFYRELPEFGLDLATYSIDIPGQQCASCHKKQVAIVGECACGRVDSCENEVCRRKWCEKSCCLNCFSIGTMSYPEYESSDDEGIADVP